MAPVTSITNIYNYYTYTNVKAGGIIGVKFDWSALLADLKIIEGSDKFNVTIVNGDLKIDAKEPGNSGTVVVVVTDKQGQTHKIEIAVSGDSAQPQVNVIYVNFAGDDDSYAFSYTKDQYRVISGGGLVIIDNGMIKPNPARTGGGKAVIEEVAADGKTIVGRYTFRIVNKATDSEHPNAGSITIRPIDGSQGGSVTVTAGKDPETGSLIITQKPNATGGIATIIERNAAGDIIREITVTIRQDGVIDTVNAGTAIIKDGLVNKDGNPVKLESGDVIRVVDVNGKPVTINIIRNDDGTLSVAPDQKFPTGGIFIVVIDREGKQTPVQVEDTDKVTVDTDQDAPSSNPKCIASGLAAGLPLLLLIPLGLLTQARVNAAFQDTNTDLQKGVGLFDENLTRSINSLMGTDMSVQAPAGVGQALGAVAAVTMGLLIGDAVMRACGAEDYTSSKALSSLRKDAEQQVGNGGPPVVAGVPETVHTTSGSFLINCEGMGRTSCALSGGQAIAYRLKGNPLAQ